MKITQR